MANAARRARLSWMGWALGVVVAALVLAFLVVGQSFLVPLVLAFLLSSMVSAVVDRIHRIQIAGRTVPNGVASMAVVLLVALVLTTLYSVAAAQINVALREGPAFISQAQSALLALAARVSVEWSQALAAGFAGMDVTPWFRRAAASVGSLLVTVVLVLLYVGFLLAERPWVQGKLARLFPDPVRYAQVQANVVAIRRSVHHYLLLKTLISAVTALLVYALARWFGLQFALSIALLTLCLNFIPNVGSIIATALPVLVALVQFEGLAQPLMVLAAVGAVQFVLGNVVDPMVTGRGLQMSSLAIVIALTFWSAVWGVVGMFLAVPLVAIGMIVCAQIPALRPVAVLLSKNGEIAHLAPAVDAASAPPP